jgi:GTP-binding protein
MFRVAIIGRPNVGKSTLFNRLCRSRKAIVGDEPGITRDRIQCEARWHGKTIEIVDTGGMIPHTTEILPAKILEQAEVAIRQSDLLLLVVDGRAGLTPLDQELAPMLRVTGRPIWVVVNKMDTFDREVDAAAFYSLGFQEVFPISAEHNRGIGDLIDAIVSRAGQGEIETAEELQEEIAVAVVGRPNVGKSSLVNRLLGTERAIVSEIPGTTRDAVDTLLIKDGIRYRLIDTAGIRRKGRTEERTEKVSVIMARKNLERADVALLVLDAPEGVTKLDAAIGGYASEAGCSVILVLNKWDLIQKSGLTLDEFKDSIQRRMKYLNYAPIIAVSAITGQRVTKILELVQKAQEGRGQRVPTGMLNNLFVPDLAEHLTRNSPNLKLEIRYITQARINPPTFVVFTSGRTPLHFSTERYLVNQLRERFGFYASPIRIRQRLKQARRRRG